MRGKSPYEKESRFGVFSETNKSLLPGTQQGPLPGAALRTHRLPRLAVVSFVTRGAILTLRGQKQVPSPSRGAPEPTFQHPARPLSHPNIQALLGPGQCAQRWVALLPVVSRTGSHREEPPEERRGGERGVLCREHLPRGRALRGGRGLRESRRGPGTERERQVEASATRPGAHRRHPLPATR